MCLKSAQFDVRAYQIFGLNTEEGEGFTEENTTIEQASDSIPVILGNKYNGMISVGQVFDISLYEYIYPCRVVGILKRGSRFPEFANVRGDMIQLDSYIILPYRIRVLNTPTELKEIQKYTFFNLRSIDNSTVRVAENEFNNLVSTFQKIGQEFGLPPIQIRLVDACVGLDLLRKDSAVSVRILLVLDNVGGGANIEVILRTAYGFTGLAFLIGIIFFVVLMRGVDTEHFIRYKE